MTKRVLINSLCCQKGCKFGQSFWNNNTLLLDADDDFLRGAFISLGDSIGIDRLQVEDGGVDVGCLGFQILGGLSLLVDLPIQHAVWTPS